MKQIDHKPTQASPLSARLATVAAALLTLTLGLAFVPIASAGYEQTGTFAGSGEEIQLGGVGGMAVNLSGAGGVKPGTVYAVGSVGGTRVAMFEPEAGGGLGFVEGWRVSPLEEPYERCGPAGTTLPSGEGPGMHPTCPALVSANGGFVDVEVDQASGNLFVFGGFNKPAGGVEEIVEYPADGGEVIARFGELAPGGEATAASPAKIHESLPVMGPLAVNAAHEVYVADETTLGETYHRLMVFKQQSPGDYAHYVYAGEVAAGGSGSSIPKGPVTDAAGNVYVVGKEGTTIEEFAPEAPAAYPAPASTPICKFSFEKGAITAMTVDPSSGEVFFFSSKRESGFKLKVVHQLSACAGGKFKEVSEFEVKPERDDLYGMAFDPLRKLTPSSEPGVLYGAAPGDQPPLGTGKGEPGKGSLGYIFSLVEENPPEVLSESVSHVTSTSAQLQARIDPKGFESHYVFQYLTEAAYLGAGESFDGAAEVPLGGATLGAGAGPQNVSATVSGLAPETEYRYRVIATSECSAKEPVCEAVGAGQLLRTYPAGAAGLPDARAYELVSPAQKSGGQVVVADPNISSCPGLVECKPGATYTHFPMQSTPDGEAIVFEGTPFSTSGGSAIEDEYRAQRTPSGWQTTNLTPPLLFSKGAGGYQAFDANLTRGLLEQRSPALSPEAPPEYPNLYTQPTSDPLALGPLLTTKPPNRAASGIGVGFALRYAGASTDFSRVFFAANDALTAATAFAPKALDGGAGKFNLYEWSGGQLRLVNVKPGNTETTPGASFGAISAQTISVDGRRAFWSDEAGQVYVREDGELTREITDHSGKFLNAAADGSKLLLSDGCLYDLEKATCEDLTAGKGGFVGVLGESEDLSHVYFLDTKALTLPGEENANEEHAEEGKNNLYAWTEGETRFLARLVAEDNMQRSSDWAIAPAGRTAQASPNGRFLTFLSQARLTGYDNTGPCEKEACPEVFLFDAATGELSCPSCNPSGARPLGGSVLRLIMGGPGSQPRYLSDSGRLVFDSQDSLSPFDTNEGVEDVYEFEPEGVGSCQRESGCVSLISAGTESIDSNFLAMDESGKNVFFTTRDRLVAADGDQLIDLYDAREGGGFASESELPPRNCQGEGCQPQSPPPPEPPPASSTLVGPGNVKPAKGCKKGQVKRNGKCVKKQKPKKGQGKHSRQHGGVK